MTESIVNQRKSHEQNARHLPAPTRRFYVKPSVIVLPLEVTRCGTKGGEDTFCFASSYGP
jgi:hypothetical protein